MSATSFMPTCYMKRHFASGSLMTLKLKLHMGAYYIFDRTYISCCDSSAQLIDPFIFFCPPTSNIYWVFDSTGNQRNGHLVRYDFQQPHGPGSMDHSVANVRRFPKVNLTRGGPGGHAGMVVHPVTGELFIADPGTNKVIAVHSDSGEYARTAREEYPIFPSGFQVMSIPSLNAWSNETLPLVFTRPRE